jgi:hypothetical protein
MIGMGAKLITIVRAVMADFVFDCRAAEVPSDDLNNQAEVDEIGEAYNMHGENRKACMILIGKPEVKTSRGRPRYR